MTPERTHIAERLGALILLHLLVFSGSGCVGPISPLSGAIAPGGTQRLDASWHLAGYSGQTVSIDNAGDERRSRVNAPGSVPVSSSYAIFSLFAFELRPTVGLIRDTEAGLLLGPERLGGHARYGWLQQQKGRIINLATGLEAGWSPLNPRGGPDIQLRLDLSARIHSWEPLINLGLRYGPTSHAAMLGQRSELFEDSASLRPLIVKTPSRDLRMSLALGTIFYLRTVERVTMTTMQLTDRPFAFHVALTPWVRLASDDGAPTCAGCPTGTQVTSDRAAWGALVVVGFNLRPGRYLF